MELVNKERRHTRHIKFTGPRGEDIECRLVYDYSQSCYVVPRSLQLGFDKQIPDGLRHFRDFVGRLTTIMMIISSNIYMYISYCTHTSFPTSNAPPMAESLSSESLSLQIRERHQDGNSDVDAETGSHLTEFVHQPTSSSWRRAIASKCPRAHTQAIRFLQYWKGPRPKIGLPGCFPMTILLQWTHLTLIL